MKYKIFLIIKIFSMASLIYIGNFWGMPPKYAVMMLPTPEYKLQDDGSIKIISTEDDSVISLAPYPESIKIANKLAKLDPKNLELAVIPDNKKARKPYGIYYIHENREPSYSNVRVSVSPNANLNNID